VDGDGSIRSAFNEDPFRQLTPHTGTTETYVPPAGSHSIEAPPEADAPPAFEAPAFVPPGVAPPVAVAEPPAPPPPPEPPSFIPPGTTLPSAPRA
jgi:hypothetical protein